MNTTPAQDGNTLRAVAAALLPILAATSFLLPSLAHAQMKNPNAVALSYMDAMQHALSRRLFGDDWISVYVADRPARNKIEAGGASRMAAAPLCGDAASLQTMRTLQCKAFDFAALDTACDHNNKCYRLRIAPAVADSAELMAVLDGALRQPCAALPDPGEINKRHGPLHLVVPGLALSPADGWNLLQCRRPSSAPARLVVKGGGVFELRY